MTVYLEWTTGNRSS